jgi:hypothetical protein
MDSSALFGLIGALLGSLVGAAGSYWATVGGSRAQSRARLGAAYRAMAARLNEERTEEAGDLERLTVLKTQLESMLKALGAASQGHPAQFPGRAGGAAPDTLAADAPSGRGWLRKQLTTIGLPGPFPSAWLGAISADVGQMDPLLYNALSAYESVLEYLIPFSNDAVPDLLALAVEIQEPDELSLQEIAQAGTLARSARNLVSRVAVLLDLHSTLAQARSEVLRLLPPVATQALASTTPRTPASPLA